jgi:hypothetical protein
MNEDLTAQFSYVIRKFPSNAEKIGHEITRKTTGFGN